MTPLVLLHAFPMESSMYDPVVHRLEATVVTPDLPGFGSTPLAVSEPNLEGYVDSVVAQLDAAGIREFVIAGTSMGGYVALALTRRFRDRVRGLALIDTKSSPDSPEAASGRRALADRLESEGSAAALLEAVLPKLLGESTQRTHPGLVAEVGASVEAVDPFAAAWAQRAMAGRRDTFDVLAGLQVPVAVVVGAEDVLTPPREAEAMASASNDAVLTVIEGAGHLTPLEAPEAVASALSDLLAQVG